MLPFFNDVEPIHQFSHRFFGQFQLLGGKIGQKETTKATKFPNPCLKVVNTSNELSRSKSSAQHASNYSRAITLYHLSTCNCTGMSYPKEFSIELLKSNVRVCSRGGYTKREIIRGHARRRSESPFDGGKLTSDGYGKCFDLSR